MKFPRKRLTPSLESFAVLALMAAMIFALVATATQISRTREAAPAIARAFREQPAQALSKMVQGGQPTFEAEVQCVACTNGPATNETPRI